MHRRRKRFRYYELEAVLRKLISEGSAVPSGVILMWAGTLASIPAGWNLCDGTNGTPDLRDKFIKGAAAGAGGGGTGGNLTHAHADHASHTHGPGTLGGTTGNNSAGDGNTTGVGVVADDPHTHPFTVTTGVTAGPSAALSHDSVNHEPPYFKLVFIQKA